MFYLVLRALDTVDDDTSVDGEEREWVCCGFWRFLDGERMEGDGPLRSGVYGDGVDKKLLERFSKVLKCYNELPVERRGVNSDITQRLGASAAEHIHDRVCRTSVNYDQFCHYEAGLVGYGLSAMFSASGAE